MANERNRFYDHFEDSFKNEGLENVKFFVRRTDDAKVSNFVADVNKMNDTIAAGDLKVVDSIEAGIETKSFDSEF